MCAPRKPLKPTIQTQKLLLIWEISDFGQKYLEIDWLNADVLRLYVCVYVFFEPFQHILCESLKPRWDSWQHLSSLLHYAKNRWRKIKPDTTLADGVTPVIMLLKTSRDIFNMWWVCLNGTCQMKAKHGTRPETPRAFFFILVKTSNWVTGGLTLQLQLCF